MACGCHTIAPMLQLCPCKVLTKSQLDSSAAPVCGQCVWLPAGFALCGLPPSGSWLVVWKILRALYTTLPPLWETWAVSE
uniref:Uncharacterized protein n=1 Tax=Timema shepardi TaxID=629360 RepID=A0A7R9G6V6_TIMSH|nr:unnamed protein product [Timema shepardi]